MINKIQWLSICMLLLLSSWGCKGPVRELRFFAGGNCEQCKEHIEGALQDQNGIHEASWDFASSQLAVSYDPRKWEESAIQELVSEAGFDTGFFDATPAAKAALPACCQEPINRKLKGMSPHGNPHE